MDEFISKVNSYLGTKKRSLAISAQREKTLKMSKLNYKVWRCNEIVLIENLMHA
jgi:hypothetical protein